MLPRQRTPLTPQTDFADFLDHASTQRTYTRIIRRNSRSVSETFNFCVTRRLLTDQKQMESQSVQYVKSRKAQVAALSSQDSILNGGWKRKIALHSFTMSRKSLRTVSHHSRNAGATSSVAPSFLSVQKSNTNQVNPKMWTRLTPTRKRLYLAFS